MMRDDYVTILRGLVGLTSPDPAYLRIATPGDVDARGEALARGSSECILVALGAQEQAWALPARAAYKPGSAPAMLEARTAGSPMHPAGAMRLATLDAPPQVGDAVWYGESAALKAEHVEHVVEVEAFNRMSLSSIALACVAGGERNGVESTIAITTRTLDWNGHAWVDRGSRRPVIGVVDFDLMCERYESLTL